MRIEFYKYQGTGNDFILVDNRLGKYTELGFEEIRKFCDRKFGIGADGFMLLNSHETYDFEMKYFNADGNESTMCGNGGRCIVQFAKDMGIIDTHCTFNAIDGVHHAEVIHENIIALGMKEVDSITTFQGYPVLDTGSPHVVIEREDTLNLDVYKEGSEIRNNPAFLPKGINVNFVKRTGENAIFVRTFERGVEDETLSCGTGVTASALSFKKHEIGLHTISVESPGGLLSVRFFKTKEQTFKDIILCGPAIQVFKGEIKT